MALQFLNDGYFAGKVGIGVESPTRTLQVNSGGANIVATFESSDTLSRISFVDSNTSSDAVVQIGADGNELVLFAGGAEHVRVDSAGNVGIGTTTPDRKLHVKDSAIVVSEFEGTNTGSLLDLVNSNASQLYNGIRFTQGTSNKMAITHIADGTTKGYVQIGNSWATGSEILVVDGRTSNVGIGTTSPSRPLHVNGGALNFVAEFQSTDDKASILIQDDDTLNYIHSQDGYLSLGGQALLSASNLNINSSSGNVGIGTTSPTQKLHVVGNARVTGAYYDSNNSPGTANQVLVSTVTGTDWVDGSAIPGVPAGSGTLNTVPLWTPDGDTLGNSIITQPSTSTIDVDGNILISDTGNDKYFGSNVNLILNADADAQSGDSARNIIFQNRGSEKMRITADGNVGIGVTSPTSRFHIYESINPSSGDLITSKIYSNGTVTANGNTRTGLDVETNRTGWYNSDATSGNFKISNNNRIGNSDLIGVKSLATVDVDNVYSGLTAAGSLTALYGKVTTTYTAGSGPVAKGYGLRIDAPEVATNSEIDTYYGTYIDGATVSGTLTNKYALVTEANAGNVGIGTTSPASKFEVYGGNSGVNDVDR